MLNRQYISLDYNSTVSQTRDNLFKNNVDKDKDTVSTTQNFEIKIHINAT